MLGLGLLGFYIFIISLVSAVVFGRCLFVLLYSRCWSNPDGYLDEFMAYRNKVFVKSLRRIPNLFGFADWEAEILFDGQDYLVRTYNGMLPDTYSLGVKCAFYRLRDRWRDGLNTPVSINPSSGTRPTGGAIYLTGGGTGSTGPF